MFDYLPGQIVWWLLLAFAAGLVLGWIYCRKEA